MARHIPGIGRSQTVHGQRSFVGLHFAVSFGFVSGQFDGV